MLFYKLSAYFAENIKRYYINNPPKNVKIKEFPDRISIRVYTRSIGGKEILLSVFFGFSAYHVFSVFFGEFINPKEINSDCYIPLLIICVLLFFAMFYIYKFIYSMFGRMEISFGKKNFIYYGLPGIGKRKIIKWDNIADYFYYLLVSEDDELIKNDNIYIRLKNDKQIRLPLDFFNKEKKQFIILMIKYLKNKFTAANLRFSAVE